VRNACNILIETPKGRDHLGGLGVGRSMILKRILKKQCVRVGCNDGSFSTGFPSEVGNFVANRAAVNCPKTALTKPSTFK
jgi:hypothetical protein